jgi:hypothetical protein
LGAALNLFGCPGLLEPEECKTGTENCGCTAELNCEEGLVCMEGMCVPDGEETSGSSESDASSEGSSSDSSEGGDGDGDSSSESTGDAGTNGGDGDGDDSDMIDIPGGMFIDLGGQMNVHDIADFKIARHEVTVEQYRECVTDLVCEPPTDSGNCTWFWDDTDGFVMNCVNWQMAKDYCEWLGRRLPTEWEWEWAARGRDEGRTYPWGEENPTCDQCIMDDGGYGCGLNSAFPPGSRSPAGDSRDGVADMAGNVMEWTDSWFNEFEQDRVLRGGAYWTSNVDELATQDRHELDPQTAIYYAGIRCAQ